MWIRVKDRAPITGAEVLCKLKHFWSGNIQKHRLIKVDEDNCGWRTADDHSEISDSWDVMEWYEGYRARSIYHRMVIMWIKVKDRVPSTGTEVLCKIKHFLSGNIQEHRLVKVDEDDCGWRTADDHSEISYSWDVMEWYEEGQAAT